MNDRYNSLFYSTGEKVRSIKTFSSISFICCLYYWIRIGNVNLNMTYAVSEALDWLKGSKCGYKFKDKIEEAVPYLHKSLVKMKNLIDNIKTQEPGLQ